MSYISARLLFISASFFLFPTPWNVKCRVLPLVIYSHCHAARKMTHLHSAEQRRHCTALPLSFTRCVAARAAVDMIGNFYSAQVLARETGFVTLRRGRSRSRTVALLFLGSRLDYRHFLDVKSVKNQSAVAAGPILCSMGPDRRCHCDCLVVCPSFRRLFPARLSDSSFSRSSQAILTTPDGRRRDLRVRCPFRLRRGPLRCAASPSASVLGCFCHFMIRYCCHLIGILAS